jgi:hypothetical protein
VSVWSFASVSRFLKYLRDEIVPVPKLAKRVAVLQFVGSVTVVSNVPRVPLNADIASLVLYAVPTLRSTPTVAVPFLLEYVSVPDATINGLTASVGELVIPTWTRLLFVPSLALKSSVDETRMG